MSKNIVAIEARDAKELEKWKKQAGYKQYAGYTVVVLLIVSLICILDEFVSNAPTSMQTGIITEFFVKGMGMDFATGLSTMGMIGVPFMFLTIGGSLYISLADRFGRKMILAISVSGMILGALVCFLTKSFAGHLFGRALLVFFVATDVHAIYVMEVAPDGKRATLGSITSFLAYGSMILISFARTAFTTGEDLNWRGVFLLPVICGIVLLVIFILFGRETKPFIDQRIQYLSTPYSKRLENTKEKGKKEKTSDKSGGLRASFKYMFQHKQPRSILFVTTASTLALMVMMGQYETIMTTSGMSTVHVTAALFMYPIMSAFISLFSGLLADKIGRKAACTICILLSFFGLALFIFTARGNVNPYLVGVGLGLALGSILAFGNIMGLVIRETVPTELRSGVTAARSICSMVFTIIGSIVFSIFISMFDLGLLSLAWCGITLLIATILFIKNVKETKDADLEAVVAD